MAQHDRERFNLYLDVVGDWRWRLTHENGNVIEDSHRGYRVKKNARKNAARILGVNLDFLAGRRGEYDDWIQR